LTSLEGLSLADTTQTQLLSTKVRKYKVHDFHLAPYSVSQASMDSQKLLGQRIRSLRQARGLTQERLGELADLNYKYLGSVERGEGNPSLLVLERIAVALGVELSDLLRFVHEETNLKTLRKSLDHLLSSANVEQLQLACKLLRALLM
jgi:transcriptional regulator with XRE-family HTH domain